MRLAAGHPLDEWEDASRNSHKRSATIAILDARRMRFEHEATPVRVDERVALASVALLSGIVQFRKSSSTSDPTHEKHDGCGVKERACRVDGGLEVLRQPSIAPDPCKEPLDDPAPRVNSEADLIGALLFGPM
jgi:hypothetical protein